MKRCFSIITVLLFGITSGVYCDGETILPGTSELPKETLEGRKINNGDEHLRQVDKLIEDLTEKIDLSTWNNLKDVDEAHSDIMPWEQVLASMEESPEKVIFTDMKCPHCGGKLVSLYYSSPSWTWKQLCGRAGPMVICPHCPAQIEFTLELMN